MKIMKLLLIVSIVLMSHTVPAAPQLAKHTNKNQLIWGTGLAAATAIGTFFSYKLFKSWRAEESRFAELRKALLALGAHITESSYNNGFVVTQSLNIDPKEQMTAEESQQFAEYSSKILTSFNDRFNTSNYFCYMFVPTVLAAIFSVGSFANAFKNS